jgi:hypothetical protein
VEVDRTGKTPIDVEEHVAHGDHEQAQVARNYRTLTQMAEEFEFFTTALYNLAGFDRDPIIEFLKFKQISDPREQPTAIDYPRPFFQGLGVGVLLGKVVNWDHRIYAIRREYWTDLRDTIAGIGWADQKRRIFARGLFHELTMVDPTQFYAAGGVLSELPLITITVFAVSSNKAFTHIQPALNPPRDLPRFHVDRPKQDMLIEAERTLGPPLSPETLSRHHPTRKE